MLKRMKVDKMGSMCKMENELLNSNPSDKLTGATADYNKIVIKICNRMGKTYESIYGLPTLGFNYYSYDECSTKYVCVLSRVLLMRVTNSKFDWYCAKYGNDKNNHMRAKFITVDKCKVLVLSERNRLMRPQSGFVTKCLEMMRTPFVMLDAAKDMISKITSTASKLLFVDILSMLLNLRDGYFTATKVCSLLMQIYTIHTRYMHLFGDFDTRNMYRPQSGANLTDLLFGFSMLGLPAEVLNAIKTFTTLTGKRVFESNLVLDIGEQIFSSLIVMIKWIANPFFNVRLLSEDSLAAIVAMIEKLGTSVFMHRDIKNVCDIYTKYVSNPQCLFDPTFREEIMTTHARLRSSASFMDYVTNGNNKYFLTTWNLFEANVVKSCQAFDTSGRDEPICFVFEGEAGSGKSCIMNQFVELLRASGRTTICHSVPAAEDGKDFYDDYENQEVFVMDDVGQQGKSQWRYLINYVSPVKYPLPCATASKKNTKFFNSKVILCTTNHFMDLNGFTSSDCISEPEALYRRAHVIKVMRGATEHFSQVLHYYKYDHIGTKRWENKFLHHASTDVPHNLSPMFDTTNEYSPANSKRVLSWLYAIFKHIEDSERRNKSQIVLDKSDYADILRTHELVRAVEDPNNIVYYDAQSFDFVKHLSNILFRCGAYELALNIVDYQAICQEYVQYYTNFIFEQMKTAAAKVSDFVVGLLPWLKSGVECASSVLFSKEFIAGVVIYVVLGFAGGWFFGDGVVSVPTIEFSEQTVKDFANIKYELEVFGAQSDIVKKDYAEWTSLVKRGCKTLVVKDYDDSTRDEHTQCIVSGKRLLLPAHLEVGNRFVDIYQTWEHYNAKHVEIENVQLKLIKKYLFSDLAVYEIIGTVPLYKLNHTIFTGEATTNKNWFLINSAGCLPVVYDLNVKRNDEEVSYSTVRSVFKHAVGTGFYTPYSAAGACGTVLAAPGVGIIGFHVAGSTNLGFCVQPPSFVMSEIRELMLDAPHAEDFELDAKVIPNFSGVRVRYEKPIEQTFTSGDTALSRSVLHVDCCEEMKLLINSIEHKPEEYTMTPLDKIDQKSPPNFKSRGNPAKTLKALSQKTFMRQGRVTPKEVEFMKECIRALMTEFDDLSDEEVAFGGEFVPPLNKDSSNGYHCKKGKDHYFDFEARVIKQEMKDLAERVRQRAENNVYDYDDFMCRETFKDELRKSTKVNDPRTFRVMPLGHIWWTKKIFGKLLKHFKATRMNTGISVGYNPYKDADELAKKLMICITTGDADFGKWDGTILAELIRLIASVFREFYKGRYPYMIEWLANTIANSFVLVNDEVWSTTHGLPSGTWLTLLLNCLINKCLTALVLYRYKPNPTVEDFLSVIDFVTGDDKVFGADAHLSQYFNLLNIKEVSESLGMDCTNGDKTQITKATQPFDKLTYVKRHFRKHPILNRYVGCLSLDTILNTLQWMNTDASDTHEAMVGKMRSMQIESYLHSPHLFNELTKIFNLYYPFDAFFDEKKVIKILNDDEGFDLVQKMQGKNYSH